MIIAGIDPGRDGAIVLLDGRAVVASTLTADLVGDAKWHAPAAYTAVAAWLRAAHAEHHIRLAVLELHAGRPGEGAGSARTIGVGWGLWLGVLAGLEVPVVTPASVSWTRALLRDVAGEGKDRAIGLTRALVPDLDLTPGRRRVPHSGLADAAALALYGATLPIARVA